MAHWLVGTEAFIVAVFTHWQNWLSGGGFGGAVVLIFALFERWSRRTASRTVYFFVFVGFFFLFSCLPAWIDEHERGDTLAGQVHQQRTEYAAKLASKDIECRTQGAELRQGIAVKEAVAQTIQKQNRDQQSTINGCLSQAMKLLTPEDQKITVLLLDRDSREVGIIENSLDSAHK